MPSTREVEDLKLVIRDGYRQPDAEFGHGPKDVIQWPLDAASNQWWRAIRVQLLAYAYGKGDEGSDDEPEFVTLTRIDNSNFLTHEPPEAEPPELDSWTREEGVGPPALLFKDLDDQQVHEFRVTSTAFDSDSDTAWAGVVEGLQQDIRTIGSTAISSTMLSQFATPGALLNFIIKHFGDAATDDPEQIGGPEVVVDVREEWRRPEGVTEWECLKWTLFEGRDADDPWYMALWRINLSANAGALMARAAPDSRGDDVIGPARLRDMLTPRPGELAAARVLRGEPRTKVAAAFDMSEAEVRMVTRAFLRQPASVIRERLSIAALAEADAMRLG
ncbi:hypothetical protein ATO6_13605 [Oceanicola sp. 22II-s10i]|uniref:hypothetical protein n=1 Tax=Oceanicola sp. 22II-s10i TaxID=1317116 RepID=UPI000B52067C|nr:hypothetical protein [Oceanicola sp. 22II-s10i]OWU84103.1 hypothetical protein ATO6_13605 [Oceanicola sp. 22II-s10i]